MSRARSAARLAAVQALYQLEMEETPLPKLLHEFHQHRLGATIGDTVYVDADASFFDDVVKGVEARRTEIDTLISANLSGGWTVARLDRTLCQILRAGTYELLARAEIPVGSIISEYMDVAHAFFGTKERQFANAVLDAVAKQTRSKSR